MDAIPMCSEPLLERWRDALPVGDATPLVTLAEAPLAVPFPGCAGSAARAGVRAVIFHPAGAVADAKLAQVRAAGAELVPVEGAFHDAFAAALELAERDAFTMVNSTNPFRLEGQKTAALELIEQLDGPPDVLALPYGGGGNTAAYA